MESRQKLIATLRQVEKLIYLAQEGRRPGSDELGLIHEGLLFAYGELREGHVLGSTETSDTGLYRLISGAMRELSEMNLPPSIDLSSVKTAVQSFKDSIFTQVIKDFKTKEELYEIGNYCWLCFRTNGLDLHHICTRGARPQAKDEPTNYLLLCRSCHQRWHDRGVNYITTHYPHIKEKVMLARRRHCENNSELD